MAPPKFFMSPRKSSHWRTTKKLMSKLKLYKMGSDVKLTFEDIFLVNWYQFSMQQNNNWNWSSFELSPETSLLVIVKKSMRAFGKQKRAFCTILQWTTSKSSLESPPAHELLTNLLDFFASVGAWAWNHLRDCNMTSVPQQYSIDFIVCNNYLSKRVKEYYGAMVKDMFLGFKDEATF